MSESTLPDTYTLTTIDTFERSIPEQVVQVTERHSSGAFQDLSSDPVETEIVLDKGCGNR